MAKRQSSQKGQRDRRAFSDEFKAKVVDLVRRGERSIGEICRELDLTDSAVRNWVRQADGGGGGRGVTVPVASMKAEDIDDFSRDLNGYLKGRYVLKRDICQVRYPTIRAVRAGFDLFFRWRPDDAEFGGHTLVLARIHFPQPRRGHGTALLRFIVERQRRYGYGVVVLEMTNEPATAFAQRIGFSPATTPCCWQMDIYALRRTLDARAI